MARPKAPARTSTKPAVSAAGEHLREHLAPLGPIAVRRMFGGAGVFRDGLMFALISDDVVFLKVEPATVPEFEAEGMAPFTYQKRDGQHTLGSYWRMPNRLLDDTDELLIWARKAIAAAHSSAARAPARKKR